MVKCDRCSKDAIIYLRYSGRHYCFEHLEDFILRRVKREIRSSTQFPRRGGKVAVAVSGGKDSLALLYILHSLLSNWRNVEIAAITVDEGIGGYREESVKYAKTVCKELGIEHHIVSFRNEFGMDLDDMVSLEDTMGDGSNGPCTYCGVFRRHLLNKTALNMGASVLAMGHVLDDMAQSVIINLMRGDINRLLRLAPHSTHRAGMVPRIVPLRMIPQQEVYLYALYKKLPIHTTECPYVARAQRNLPLDLIAMAEDRLPGTRHGLLKSWEGIMDLWKNARNGGKDANNGRGGADEEWGVCGVCGGPTSGRVCAVCTLKKNLEDMAKGSEG